MEVKDNTGPWAPEIARLWEAEWDVCSERDSSRPLWKGFPAPAVSGFSLLLSVSQTLHLSS